MSEAGRRMVLIGFLQAANCSNHVHTWRHPSTMLDFTSPEYYQRLARILEDGKFDLAFFDDRLAMPDRYGDDFGEAVRHGVKVVKLDITTILAIMGMATTRLGLGATYSTTYYPPYHIARVFGTLDLMLKGRAAWNVVTSLNDAEAANFGHEESMAHDLRYDAADETMEAVLGHWDTWEDDAIIADKSGDFADPSKVHRLDYRGRWVKSRGPLTVPRSPQGYPVVMQAGQSGRGKAFAARWAELIFTLSPNLEMAQRYYREVKGLVAANGRDPSQVKIVPAINVVVGETKAIAEAKLQLVEGLAKPIDFLVQLSEGINFDFATKQLDEEFTDEELASIKGAQVVVDKVRELSGKRNPTVREYVKYFGEIVERPAFVGTPSEVADGLERWFVEEGCDGFVLRGLWVPGTYEDFVRLVVPELQRRGLFRKEYEGTTLRENLGLARPERGAWRLPAERT